VGVDPDEVADGRKLEDTSSGCQSECRAADLCPWKGVLPSGHRNLEPFDKNNGLSEYHAWLSNGAINPDVPLL